MSNDVPVHSKAPGSNRPHLRGMTTGVAITLVSLACMRLVACAQLSTANDAIVVTLSVVHNTVADSVPITLSVTNFTSAPVDVALGGPEARPHFDVIIQNEAGMVVWRRFDTPEGSAFTLPLHTRRIPANASLQYSTVWRVVTTDGTPVPSGTYRVRGEIDAGGRLRTTPTVTVRVSR